MNTAQKMKFSIKDFFSKCDQIRSFLRIWSHLLKKSLIEYFVFWVVEWLSIISFVGFTSSRFNYPIYPFNRGFQYFQNFEPTFFDRPTIDPREDCRDLTVVSKDFCSTNENRNLFKFQRTVSGICNNLTPGKGAVGAADTQVARLARKY